MRDDRLARTHVECAVLVLNVQQALEHRGELVKLRGLSRLLPSAWTAHMRDAYRSRAGIYPPNVLVNQLRLVTCSLNSRRV